MILLKAPKQEKGLFGKWERGCDEYSYIMLSKTIKLIRKQNEKANIPEQLNNILSFSFVRITFPRIKILKLFHRPQDITYKEYLKICKKQREIKRNIYKLQHTLSVVERIINIYEEYHS